MSATPTPARRAVHQRRSNPIPSRLEDVKDQPGRIYETLSVQDRIRKWQEHGAATAPAPDLLSVVSPPGSGRVTPAQSETLSPTGHLHKTEEREQPPAATSPHTPRARRTHEWNNVGRISTPRKQVVGDDNWRKQEKNRSAPARAETKSSRPFEQALLETILPNRDIDRTIIKAKVERDERRRRRKEARTRKANPERHPASGSDHWLEGDSGIGIHGDEAWLDETHSHDGALLPSMQAETPEDEVRTQQLSPEQDLSASPAMDDGNDGRTEHALHMRSEDAQVWQPSKYAATLGQPPPQYSANAGPKSKKEAFLDKTKDLLGISEATPHFPNRLSSIEVWLEEQPDPFTDGTNDAVGVENTWLPREIHTLPKLPKDRSTRRKTSNSRAAADPNQIWNSVSADHKNRSPGTRGTVSQIDGPQATDLPTSSPAGLKRSGAKSSRPKRHTVSESVVPMNVKSLHRVEDTRAASNAVIHNDGHDSKVTLAYPPVPSIPEPAKPLPPLVAQECINALPTPNESVGRITTHDDLMSQLSRTNTRRSNRRNPSTRMNTRHGNKHAFDQVFASLREEEKTYGRELRTLVDGVIPVLLQCMLSKKESNATVGLFTPLGNDKDFMKLIVDLGVALERLKSLHGRIPLHSVDSLLSWCQSAHKAYTDYINAWRLGFQDVVVNLAPPDDDERQTSGVIDRDANDDVVHTDGESVDVAHLLKRPMIRIRKIGKVLCSIKEVLEDNPIVARLADDFADLTMEARRKLQQEKGRLEDEAAATIDATKCRDIKTMAPLPDVVIDRTRKVRARDWFTMTLFHSSGQRLDCKVEIILRDSLQGSHPGGDILICEIDEDTKWLLFAPVEIGYVSARRGEAGCDLVIMIRGWSGVRGEWRELLALKTEELATAHEWLNMLGSNPLPPKLSRVPSFMDLKKIEVPIVPGTFDAHHSDLEKISPCNMIDVPLGEPSVISTTDVSHRPAKAKPEPSAARAVPRLNLGGGLQRKPLPQHWHEASMIQMRESVLSSVHSSDLSTVSGKSATTWSKSASDVSNTSKPLPPPAVANPQSSVTRALVSQPLPSEAEESRRAEALTPKAGHTQQDTAVATLRPVQDRTNAAQSHRPDRPSPPVKPEHSTRLHELNGFEVSPPKSRTSSSSTPLTTAMRDTWAMFSGKAKKSVATSEVRQVKQRPVSGILFTDDVPPPPPGHNHRYSMPVAPSKSPEEQTTPPLATDNNRTLASRPPNLPTLRSPKNGNEVVSRRSSSPLKNEYAASTAESDSNLNGDISSDTESNSSSDTSQDLGQELNDDLKSLPVLPNQQRQLRVWQAPPTSGSQTLVPSDSASQGPYRRVPPSQNVPADKKRRAIATVCAWSDKGVWEPVTDDECSILISPGRIEAFPMSAGHSQPLSDAQPGRETEDQPIVAFELTPIVPLRKGTALDITIRSPPTPNSRMKTTNNIMFRSRTVVECEVLYHMINWARCNNPTFIELERARPPPQPAIPFVHQTQERSRSWFSFGGRPRRQNSFRAGSMPPTSIADSAASSGTMYNALSALKQFSKSSPFSITRSSVVRRNGRPTVKSAFSADEIMTITNNSGSGSSTPAPASQFGFVPKDGPNVPQTSAEAVSGAGMVNNVKIRLFERNGQNWKALGSARLAVLPAAMATPNGSRPSSSAGPVRVQTPPGSKTDDAGRRPSLNQPFNTPRYRLPSSSYTPHRMHGNGREKRILITKNNEPGAVLLDATLSESCFEKVMQCGIAVNVWTEIENGVADRGGVMTGRGKVYMMQFGSASECQWVFQWVGTYRYGAGTVDA